MIAERGRRSGGSGTERADRGIGLGPGGPPPMTWNGMLFDFDLSGGQDIAGGECGELDFLGSPSFVAKSAAGGFAAGRDVTDQLDRVAIGFGVGAFDSVDDRSELEVALHRFARVFLNVADGCA